MSELTDNPGKHSHKDRADDLYETPRCAVDALLHVERLPRYIWEPACGPGAIVKALRERGHIVWASDLNEHYCPDATPRIDFLMEWQQRVDCEAIVTNPPYKLADQFVEQALFHAPLVCMLLRLAFLEGVGRSNILDGGKLARVHVFRNRLPRMHRAGWDGKRAASRVAYAWFVWDRFHQGPATINRISWEGDER